MQRNIRDLAHRLGVVHGAVLLVAVFLLALAGRLDAAERHYVVKPGDTLSGVALKSGLGVATLAERNGLKPTARLMVGQKLVIPTRSAGSRTTKRAKPALPAPVAAAINAARVKPGRWKRIVIHHSGTAEGTPRGMNEYHLKVRHMEHGLAYHFVIGNGHGMGNGEIYVGNRWKQQFNGGHLASETQNTSSLGICLVGNYDVQAPTARQMQSLEALIEALQRRCRLNDRAVVTHQQINVIGTRCPGRRFPLTTLLDNLSRD